MLVEVVPRHPRLKVWKGKPLETDTLSGFADYLIAPKRAYIKIPLLCVVEAKGARWDTDGTDYFEGGEAQCVAEMVACRWKNRHGSAIPIHGIVSNGDGWQFYCLTPQNTVLQSALFGLSTLPELLAALDFVGGECAKHVP